MRNDCFIGQVPVSTGHPERDVHVPICPHCVFQEAGTRGIFDPSFMQGRPLPQHTQSELWTVQLFYLSRHLNNCNFQINFVTILLFDVAIKDIVLCSCVSEIYVL